MKGTYEKSFERFNSTKVQNSSIPSLSSKPNKFKMHPWFVTGFTDGEGCFHISITKDKGKKVGWIIKLIFQISLHEKYRALLEQVNDFFGVDNIYQQGPQSIIFQVCSIKDLKIIFNHFNKFPMVTEGCADYLLFKQAYNLMIRKEHLTFSGLHKNSSHKSFNESIDWGGLSDELKKAFPDVEPVSRPIVQNKLIPDPEWLAGFTCAEGCYSIAVYKAKTNTGEAIKLQFIITQHARDEQLILNMIDYFGVGQVEWINNAVDFKVTRFKDITDKVLPLFSEI